MTTPNPNDRLTYTATFADGHTATRTASRRHAYTHASMVTRPVAGPGARLVRFHRSEDAARAMAGKRAKIAPVSATPLDRTGETSS